MSGRKLSNVISLRLEAATPRGFRSCRFGKDGQRYAVRSGYRLVACDGGAHSNQHIDNCSRCAPLWGVIAVEDD